MARYMSVMGIYTDRTTFVMPRECVTQSEKNLAVLSTLP
jgi:hypothetical protein